MTKENIIAKKQWENHIKTIRRNQEFSKKSIAFFKDKIKHYESNIKEELIEIALDKKSIDRAMQIIKNIK